MAFASSDAMQYPLRHFQKDAISAIENPNTSQNHVLCVAATGSGKSLIYERAAQISGRKTLLVTPLVALARQQFERLSKLGILVRLGAGGNSEPPPPQTGAWIMSPETLNYPSKRKLLERWKPNLLVVDECHCLWEWGEKFRPAFSLIPELLQVLPIFKSIWLTATLPYEARVQLRTLIPHPLVELGQFNLPSRLRLHIQKIDWEDRIQGLIAWIQKLDGPGIIFVSTRESTVKIGRLIQAMGKITVIYHGGMSSEERKNTEALVSKKIPQVIVATSAFGMGMDYDYLRYVILYQAPTSLLSLVQTIGRVRRSEDKYGQAVVLWHPDDFRLLEWTIGDSNKRRNDMKDLIYFLDKQMCRRAALKWYFDRTVGPQRCELCDFCTASLV